jgi:hypothetical protein
MPSSRVTIAAWDSGAPTSVTWSTPLLALLVLPGGHAD